MNTTQIKNYAFNLLIGLGFAVTGFLVIAFCYQHNILHILCAIDILATTPLFVKFANNRLAVHRIHKHISKQDAQTYKEMLNTVKNATNEELCELNKEFHNGIAESLRNDDSVSNVAYKIDALIETEMHNRGLTTCKDLEV